MHNMFMRFTGYTVLKIKALDLLRVFMHLSTKTLKSIFSGKKKGIKICRLLKCIFMCMKVGKAGLLQFKFFSVMIINFANSCKNSI